MNPATPAQRGVLRAARCALIDTLARCSLQLSFASPNARADDRWVRHLRACATVGWTIHGPGSLGAYQGRFRRNWRTGGLSAAGGGWVADLGRQQLGRCSGREEGSWEPSILVFGSWARARLASLGHWGTNVWVLEGDDSAFLFSPISCYSDKLQRRRRRPVRAVQRRMSGVPCHGAQPQRSIHMPNILINVWRRPGLHDQGLGYGCHEVYRDTAVMLVCALMHASWSAVLG